MWCVKDTLVVEHDVGVAQLNRVDHRCALVQIGHREVRGSVWPQNTVLEVQLILVTGHGQLYAPQKGFEK